MHNSLSRKQILAKKKNKIDKTRMSMVSMLTTNTALVWTDMINNYKYNRTSGPFIQICYNKK